MYRYLVQVDLTAGEVGFIGLNFDTRICTTSTPKGKRNTTCGAAKSELLPITNGTRKDNSARERLLALLVGTVMYLFCTVGYIQLSVFG